MFTDMVGYTRISQVNESLAVELLHELQELVRHCLTTHGGAEVKEVGDGFLVEFKSALDAVDCAVELQDKIGRRNELTHPRRKLELRIGIHVGDVVHERRDIYGDAVNLASRIQEAAEPGGTCISQQVYDQVRNKTELAFERMGDVKLKNVDVPLGLYRVKAPGGPRPEGARESNPRERLGVLPFLNISPDPNDDYFADGLTEEIISRLSQIRNLKVVARTSMMSYKGKRDKKLSEIARELGVGSLIEGSVRKAGNKVRISVQLIDALSEERLWSSNYDGSLDDIFGIQSDVASKVARSLSTGVFSVAPKRETDDIEAYVLYLKAMHLSYDTSEATLRERVSLLEGATAKDPSFARAYAELAGAWQMLGSSGYHDFAAAAVEADAAAARALELDPGLAEAHAAMSGVHQMFDRFEGALAEAEAAVRINPNLSQAYMTLGVLDAVSGSKPGALAMFRRAYELDPLSFHPAEMLVSAACHAGGYAEARKVLERMVELKPKDPKTYLLFADYYMAKKEFEEAQRMVDSASGLSPGEPTVLLASALLFGVSGKRREALRALGRIMANENESYRLLGTLWVRAALGDLDEAFAALMRLAETHSWPFDITVDPLYSRMRKDSKFEEFRRKVGIDPASSP